MSMDLLFGDMFSYNTYIAYIHTYIHSKHTYIHTHIRPSIHQSYLVTLITSMLSHHRQRIQRRRNVVILNIHMHTCVVCMCVCIQGTHRCVLHVAVPHTCVSSQHPFPYPMAEIVSTCIHYIHPYIHTSIHTRLVLVATNDSRQRAISNMCVLDDEGHVT